MNCDFVRKLGISSGMSNVHIIQVSGRTMGMSGSQMRSHGAFCAREGLGGGSSMVHQGCRSVCSQVPHTEATAMMSFNPPTIPGTAMILQKARPGHREDMK